MHEIRTSGAGATGVFVTAIGTGAIGGASTINSTGQINTIGANATRVLVNGGAGAVAVNNTGLVSATGVNSAGISLQSGPGARTIVSNRIAAGSGNGIDVTTGGIVDIRSTSITRNAFGFGINVLLNTYAGPTTITGGHLSVNGSIVSPIKINSDGTLGGTGSVGSTTVPSGGTWALCNSTGTQTVNGNVTFAAGSIYQVEANAAGAADRINATGTTTLAGGTVQVLAQTGTYASRTDYTILTAAGGVSGRFAGVTSNLALLTPLLGYAGIAVTLALARNDISFGTVAATDNQRAAANAIFARGPSDALFTNILFRSTDGAQTAFTALSGELNAGLADNGRHVCQAVPDRGASGSTAQGLRLGHRATACRTPMPRATCASAVSAALAATRTTTSRCAATQARPKSIPP